MNIKISSISDDFQGNIEYTSDLKILLIFPFLINPIEESKKTEYRKLKIKTNQKESEFFRGINGKGGIGNKFTPLENYWNLCVPNDKKGFSMIGCNDELTLEDKEKKVYLEIYHFPHAFISVKIQSISLVIEDSKNPSINIKVEEFETKEGKKFTTSEYQSLIRKIVKDKRIKV
ncbi:MAG: hypothetical protein mread185_000628 [Mycoplasmataceae bacterium]|nr:MAG: hypothetical protein mread185_000628 [Mycoplasmataceae bacterium]